MLKNKDDEDEAFDANGILRDGKSFRVDVRFCDSMQRSVAKHAANLTKPTKQHITDGYGNDGLALHRPGARLLAGGSARTQSAWDAMNRVTEQAYAEWEHRQTNAWKDSDDDDSLLDADFDVVDDAARDVDAEYNKYNDELINAWKYSK